MLEFLVYSGPWKNRFIDRRNVLLQDEHGQPAHLAFVLCKSRHKAWAHVDNRPVEAQLVAQQLLAFNPQGLPARVFASAPVRKQVSLLCGTNWTWPTPQTGGENASGALRTFEANVSFSLGRVSKCSLERAQRAQMRYPEVTALCEDLLWENQFTLQAWNEMLQDCADLLLPSSREPGCQRDEENLQRSFGLLSRLYQKQRTLPALAPPLPYLAPPPQVTLDGEKHYPRSVREALEDWELGAQTTAAVKRVPWPAAKEHIVGRAAALEGCLQPHGAKLLAALAFASQEWAQMLDALQLLEEYAVWETTFPLYKYMGDLSWEKEKQLRDVPCLRKMLGDSEVAPGFRMPLDHLLHRYLRSHFPVTDVELASGGQMMFCCRTLDMLDVFETLSDETRVDCARALLGLDERGLHKVRAWRDDHKDRKEGSFGLTPQAARAANRALWDALGNAPGRWIRMEELTARLRGSEVWARSYLHDGTLSPALVAQACAGSDSRVLLTLPDDDASGPAVRGLVCTEPVARTVVQAGWTQEPGRFASGEKSAVIKDSGPLPARNCVYFHVESGEREEPWPG